MAIYPSGNYRNPASLVDEMETRPIKLAYGCSACEHNIANKYNLLDCWIDHIPGYGGYCPKWSLSDDWDNGITVN